MATDYEFFSLKSAESTQAEALERWSNKPVVVYAERQTNGKGRAGDSWLSADRSLAVSVTFRTQLPTSERSVLALVAGLCAHETLTHAGCEGIGIKWPNDLLNSQGAKVAGILVESSDWSVTVGIGANLWHQGDLVDDAGWLYTSDPGASLGPTLSRAFAERFLATADLPFNRPAFVERCVTVGTPITWEGGGSGVAVDVAIDGRLVVETATGIELLSSGAVRHVRSVS